MSDGLEFKSFVLDQLSGFGDFETKNMFGCTALLRDGVAFAKVKHGALWLKADSETRGDFLAAGMPQYVYGKDKSRKLNFFKAPAEVLEDPESLAVWAAKAWEVAQRSRK